MSELTVTITDLNGMPADPLSIEALLYRPKSTFVGPLKQRLPVRLSKGMYQTDFLTEWGKELLQPIPNTSLTGVDTEQAYLLWAIASNSRLNVKPHTHGYEEEVGGGAGVSYIREDFTIFVATSNNQVTDQEVDETLGINPKLNIEM